MEQLELFPANITNSNPILFFTGGTTATLQNLYISAGNISAGNAYYTATAHSWPSYTTEQVRTLLDVVTSKLFWVYQDPEKLKDLENLKIAYDQYLTLAKLTLGDDFVKLMQDL